MRRTGKTGEKQVVTGQEVDRQNLVDAMWRRTSRTDWWTLHVCRYQAVLTACCLRPDLALLPSADLTEVTSLPACG